MKGKVNMGFNVINDELKHENKMLWALRLSGCVISPG